jgi:hypothetical protein
MHGITLHQRPKRLYQQPVSKRQPTLLPVAANAHAVDFSITGILIYINLFDINLLVKLLGAGEARCARNAISPLDKELC